MLRLLILFLIVPFSVFSQYKFEKEYKISSEKAPLLATEFINKCDFSKKIKWYAEESQEGKSFEAKTFYKKKKYSIEFDESGKLIDAEIKIKFIQLPLKIQALIREKLSTIFKKHKIEKVQIQYSGAESSIYKAIFNLKTEHDKANINYELIVKGYNKKTYLKYEFLFDKNGSLLKQLPFLTDNLDNIEF